MARFRLEIVDDLEEQDPVAFSINLLLSLDAGWMTAVVTFEDSVCRYDLNHIHQCDLISRKLAYECTAFLQDLVYQYLSIKNFIFASIFHFLTSTNYHLNGEVLLPSGNLPFPGLEDVLVPFDVSPLKHIRNKTQHNYCVVVHLTPSKRGQHHGVLPLANFDIVTLDPQAFD